MRLLLALAAVLLLAACQEETPDVDPARFDAAERSCARDEGRWVERPNGAGMVCLRTPRDSGKACRVSSDCEGQCLARSGTCAPVIPLFGCNEVLGTRGERSTICVQ